MIDLPEGVSPHYLSKGFHNTVVNHQRVEKRYTSAPKLPKMKSQATERMSDESDDSLETRQPRG
jgi:hypothetical protein